MWTNSVYNIEKSHEHNVEQRNPDTTPKKSYYLKLFIWVSKVAVLSWVELWNQTYMNGRLYTKF